MKRFFILFFFSVCGLLILPFCVSATWSAISLVASLRPQSFLAVPVAAWAMASGFALWLLIFYALPRPTRTYVLAHELTHALWAYLTGSGVRRMSLSRNSGSVVVTKNNILITLAPYFFPLYTVIVIILYYILSLFWNLGAYEWVWLFLV